MARAGGRRGLHGTLSQRLPSAQVAFTRPPSTPFTMVGGAGHDPRSSRRPAGRPGGAQPVIAPVASLLGLPRQSAYGRRPALVLVNGLAEQAETWFRNLGAW